MSLARSNYHEHEHEQRAGTERYSARQDTKMKMGEFVGEAEYRGKISGFVALLKLGEKFHVGKATGFGLGQYVTCSNS